MQEVGQAPGPWLSLHEVVGSVLTGLSKERELSSAKPDDGHSSQPALPAGK